MNKPLVTCLALCASLYSAAALAASGELWEITSKTEMPGMPFAMPATTQQVCLAKGEATDPHKSAPPDKDCQITDIKKSGNKTSWKIRCDRNGEVMNGSGEITTRADGYEGVTRLNGKSGGHDIDMTSHFSGKKLGQSCDASKLSKQVEQAQQQAAPANGDTGDSAGSSLGDSAKKLKGLLGF